MVSGNVTWLRNLYEPLREMEHDVVLLANDEGKLAMKRADAKQRSAFSQKILDTFQREHARKPFALVFTYLMDGMVDTSVIDEIRRTGVPTCNFSCNNTHQFHLVAKISSHFDLNLHAEKDARAKFEAVNANPLWWPMASNPRYFKPYDIPRTIQASFVGANYALRARYISYLLEHGIDVHAFGPGWRGDAQSQFRSSAKRYGLILRTLTARRVSLQASASARLAEHDFRRTLSRRFPKQLHAPVSDSELISLYSSSHVSLGFLEVHDHHDPSRMVKQHLHLREFEAPLSGALYLTGWMDELAEMFEPDKEVLVYRNQYEMLEKLRYYLTQPQEAERVRQAGRRRALSEHTYHHRFATLFQALALPYDSRQYLDVQIT